MASIITVILMAFIELNVLLNAATFKEYATQSTEKQRATAAISDNSKQDAAIKLLLNKLMMENLKAEVVEKKKPTSDPIAACVSHLVYLLDNVCSSSCSNQNEQLAVSSTKLLFHGMWTLDAKDSSDLNQKLAELSSVVTDCCVKKRCSYKSLMAQCCQ